MTKMQQLLADPPEEKRSLSVPVFGSMEKSYTVVYLIARNEHVADQEKPGRYEDRLQVICRIRNRTEKLVSSHGLGGGEIVADIASDYFEDYVNYKEPELDITNDELIAILQKIQEINIILLCGNIDIIRYHHGFDDSSELNWYLTVT